jgi:hypothetical protein
MILIDDCLILPTGNIYRRQAEGLVKRKGVERTGVAPVVACPAAIR